MENEITDADLDAIEARVTRQAEKHRVDLGDFDTYRLITALRAARKRIAELEARR